MVNTLHKGGGDGDGDDDDDDDNMQLALVFTQYGEIRIY
jgi:hypothetical protein